MRRLWSFGPTRAGAFALIALASAPALPAQTPSLRLNNFSMDDGLSQSTVWALHRDARGFLWIGTQDGLNRFDGTSFRAYRHVRGDSSSIGDDFVNAIHEDPHGTLWVGTERGGLARFDATLGTFRNYPLGSLGPWMGLPEANGTPGRTVWEIVPGFAGTLLLASDVGAVAFDTTMLAARPLRPGQEPARAILRLGRDVWVGYVSGRLIRFRHDSAVDGFVAMDSISLGAPIRRLRASNDRGAIWVGTRGEGLFLVDTAPLRILDRPLQALEADATAGVLEVLPMSDGGLWVGLESGLAYLDRAGQPTLWGYDPEDVWGLSDQSVTRLLAPEGPDGELWVGTWNGLGRMDPLNRVFRAHVSGTDTETGLKDGVIAIQGGPAGNLWLGTDGSGLIRWDHHRGRRTLLPADPSSAVRPSSDVIFDLTLDQPRGLWVATFGGGVDLLRSDSQEFVRVPLDPSKGGLPGNRVNSVFVDRGGRVWCGSRDAGLQRFNPSLSRFERISREHKDWTFGSDYVWPIVETSDSTLWVGAFQGGLSRISPDRQLQHLYGVDDGLSDDRILTLYADSENIVWIGTQGGGLNRFDPKSERFTVYTVEDGLPHDHVEGILEDDRGFLWVSTNDGLARFDRGTEEFWIFKEAVGLAGDRFYANSAYKDGEGLLYFGGPNGLTIVDPSKVEKRHKPPPVVLTDFHIHGREAPVFRALVDGGLDLQPDENFFTFTFAALDFTDVSQNRYRYRLDPLDDEWVDIGNDNVANYTSVPAGHYTFRVAARNSENVWNEEGLAIPVRVRAPYYQTWPFRLALGALALLLITGLYAYRLRELQRRQALRLGIAGKLHDDIGANLSAIALKSEMVGRGLDLDARRSKQLSDVGRLARDTAHKVRETVWVVNTQYDTVAGLLSKMRDTADMILEGQTAFVFRAPEDAPARPIDMEVRQDVYLLFKEVLHNIVKHANAKRVEINVRYQAPIFTFSVMDDGVGFDPSDPDLGNGLGLMRNRASKHRGTLTVDSAPGDGTRVELRVKMK